MTQRWPKHADRLMLGYRMPEGGQYARPGAAVVVERDGFHKAALRSMAACAAYGLVVVSDDLKFLHDVARARVRSGVPGDRIAQLSLSGDSAGRWRPVEWNLVRARFTPEITGLLTEVEKRIVGANPRSPAAHNGVASTMSSRDTAVPVLGQENIRNLVNDNHGNTLLVHVPKQSSVETKVKLHQLLTVCQVAARRFRGNDRRLTMVLDGVLRGGVRVELALGCQGNDFLVATSACSGTERNSDVYFPRVAECFPEALISFDGDAAVIDTVRRQNDGSYRHFVGQQLQDTVNPIALERMSPLFVMPAERTNSPVVAQ